MTLATVLRPRVEPLSLTSSLEHRQRITIRFTGEIVPRSRGEPFKGATFAAYAGDLVFSKIDARNGAIGIVPPTIPKVVVTSEYPVFVADESRIRIDYLRHLLRARHFQTQLQREASGTSGRKRIKPSAFTSLSVPIPSLAEQDALVADYEAALARATAIEREAQTLEADARAAFEEALGIAPPPPPPNRPLFVARFKDIERWSHDAMMRASTHSAAVSPKWPTAPIGAVVSGIKHGCSAGPAKRPTTLRVLRISAVTKGALDADDWKYLPDREVFRQQFDLRAGDVLICRTNGTLAYVGMAALVERPPVDTVFPDKIIRVRPDTARVDPEFLWRLLQTGAMRQQIEGAARTAVGNYAIGGADIARLVAPMPPLAEQRQLAATLALALADAADKRKAAQTLRAEAWSRFESALFA